MSNDVTAIYWCWTLNVKRFLAVCFYFAAWNNAVGVNTCQKSITNFKKNQENKWFSKKTVELYYII